MYETVRYLNNYLQEVICRLDFATPIMELKKSMPKPIFEVVKKYYPIAEPQDVIGTELNINPINGPTINKTITKQWVFISRDRMNRCTIEAEEIIFSIRNYSVFEDLRNSVIDILKSVMKQFPDHQGKRFGLRYINDIPIKDHTNWIVEKFFSALAEHKDEKTTKLLTTLEYSLIDTGLNVRLNYGFNNPDYPAIMKRDNFVIDIDAYVSDIIYEDDIHQLVENMHAEDQDCFEKMITDEFRKALNYRE